MYAHRPNLTTGPIGTATIISICSGIGIFGGGICLLAAEYLVARSLGGHLTVSRHHSAEEVSSTFFVIDTIMIAPIVETFFVRIIFIVLRIKFNLPNYWFVAINSFLFGLLHPHFLNGLWIFLVLSVQYVWMHRAYGKRLAFWSIAASHSVNNGLVVASVLFLSPA